MGGSGACRLEGNEKAGSVGTEGSTEDMDKTDAYSRPGNGSVGTGVSTEGSGRADVVSGYNDVIWGNNDGVWNSLGTRVGSGVHIEVETGDTGRVLRIFENNREYPVSRENKFHWVTNSLETHAEVYT